MSEVLVCNQALANLGLVSRILSISPPEPRSAEAELCALFYPQCRDELLQGYDFGFNVKRAELARLYDIPAFGWQYAFALPPDFLHLNKVTRLDSGDPSVTGPTQRPSFLYSIERGPDDDSQMLLTSVSRVGIVYRARVVTFAQFSPAFTTALSWRLSAALAGPFIKGERGAKLAQEHLGIARAFALEAAALHANSSDFVAWGRSPSAAARL